jgi:hypothetical protein
VLGVVAIYTASNLIQAGRAAKVSTCAGHINSSAICSADHADQVIVASRIPDASKPSMTTD